MAKCLFISVILVTVATYVHSVDINVFLLKQQQQQQRKKMHQNQQTQQHRMHKIKSRFACALRLFIDCVFELDDDGNLFLV